MGESSQALTEVSRPIRSATLPACAVSSIKDVLGCDDGRLDEARRGLKEHHVAICNRSHRILTPEAPRLNAMLNVKRDRLRTLDQERRKDEALQ